MTSKLLQPLVGSRRTQLGQVKILLRSCFALLAVAQWQGTLNLLIAEGWHLYVSNLKAGWGRGERPPRASCSLPWLTTATSPPLYRNSTPAPKGARRCTK